MTRNILGICYHERHELDPEVDESTFKWKGCWSCRFYGWKEPKPLLDVEDLSEKLGVSRSTVRRRIRNGKLNGKLFEQGRHPGRSLPAPKKYFVRREDFEKYRGGENDVD